MDINAINSLISALMSSIEIIKTTFKTVKDADLKEKISDLQDTILSAQSHALAAHLQYQELSQVKSDIEKQLIKYKDWTKTESQYELQDLGRGAFIYVPKDPLETRHYLCTNCYQNKVKSLLQYKTSVIGGHHYYCPNPNCNMILFTREPIETYFQKNA